MKVRFIMSPVHSPETLFEVDEPLSLAEVLDRVAAPDWFRDFGKIRIGADFIPRAIWHLVRLRPEVNGYCDLVVVPKGKNTLPLLLTVATVALASAVSGGLLGPAALGLGGATFAAGGLGATLAAAAIGIGGQLLVSALTAPPSIGQQSQSNRQLSQAGINVNPAILLENLPVIFGKVRTSPPQLMQGYTEYIDGELWLNTAVGVEGRCLIENIKINGIDAALVEGAVIETQEGAGGEAAPAICARTVVMKAQNSQQLSNVKTVDERQYQDELADQANPDNSMPDWHTVKSEASWTEFWIRLLLPAGAINTETGEDAAVPIRLEARLVGSGTWRRFPTIHVQDPRNGTGPVRAELKIKRELPPGGLLYTWTGDEWPVQELNASTGTGRSFEYLSDSYFIGATFVGDGLLPDFSGYTSGIYTWSASSEFSTSTRAWNVSDHGSSNYWRPAHNSLPATLTLTCSTPTEFRSFMIFGDTGATLTQPITVLLEGLTGGNWITLAAIERPPSNNTLVYNIGNPDAYDAYRWTFYDNNGAVSQEVRVGKIRMFGTVAAGTALEDELGGSSAYNIASDFYTLEARCVNAEATPDGATFYLDPDEWPAGAYEFRLKRGTAFQAGGLEPRSYGYASDVNNGDFFERTLSSGVWVVRIGQKDYRTDIVIEATANVEDGVAPFDHTGLALITFRVPALQVDSVSADFTRYGREHDGSIWVDAMVPTQNPAALYRDVLLGLANVQPVPGEVIDEDALTAWFNRCESEAYQCNAVVQGQSVEAVLQMLASTGFAKPRHANVESITEDYDTSAQPIELMLTPLNSRDLGTSIALPKKVHCIIAEYFDETDDYKLKQEYIYKDGYSAANATLFETWSLPGFTSSAKAIARATFDLAQSQKRAFRYRFEVGVEAYNLRPGSVVGVTSDVLNRKQSFGLIKSVEISGGNVISITLDNLIPWSESLIEPEDVDAFLSGSGDTMGVAIQLADGSTTLIKSVTETSDSNTATFATPFADTGVVVPGLMVATGVAGKTYKRCKVMSIVPQSDKIWTIELADEAVELFS